MLFVFFTECSKEQQVNFFKMCYLVFDVVTKGLRVVFKREWDFHFKEMLGEWMDKPTNGREFYLKETPRNQIKHAHLLATMRNGNTEEWDITMLCYAIMYSDSIGSSLTSAVRSQVDVLRNVRNKTVNSSRASLSVVKLQDIVEKVQIAFKSLDLSTQKVQDLDKQAFQFEPIKGSNVAKEQLEKQGEDPEFEDQEDISSFCRLPLKPPLDIIGRESDKDKIVQELKKLKTDNEGGLSCLIISGRPGSGKSQLARQVAESFYYEAAKITDAHTFVMSLNAESSESLLESFTSFAQHVKCSEIEVNNILAWQNGKCDEKISVLKDLIEERIQLYTTWLLVIDNVTGLRNILMSLPQAGNALWKTGQMLITTRDTVSELPEDTFTSHISINKGMESNVAVSLMAAVSGTDDKEMLEKVAKELDYQPLALVSAATCVKQDCQSNKEPYLAWTEILNALRTDKEMESVSGDISTSESSILKSTDVIVRRAVEALISTNEVIKHALTFLSLFKRHVFDLDTLVTYYQTVEELQDKEEIRKTNESQIKACPLLLLGEDANNVNIGIHQVVLNGIRSTLEKHSIADSQLLAAFKLSSQMQIDPLEKSRDEFDFEDRIIPMLPSIVRLTGLSVG